MPVIIRNLALTSALGKDLEETRHNLAKGVLPKVEMVHILDSQLPVMRAPFDAEQPLEGWPEYDSRNNRLLWQSLEPLLPDIKDAIKKYGSQRIGICLGTSTSGIKEAEDGYKRLAKHGEWSSSYHYHQHELNSGSDFLCRKLGLKGPAMTVSTACSSSAKALNVAKRWLNQGWCDVVLTGGCDTLCDMTLIGFYRLGAYSNERCNPFSANRSGIHIGEASALFLLERGDEGIELASVGESSDAHHISAPNPDGHGAALAMQWALDEAKAKPSDVDYVNLHGTGTPLNDAMESLAMATIFPHCPPASSTKPLTGHTLGAAGAIEVGFSILAMTDGRLPLHHFDAHLPKDFAVPNLVTLSSQVQKLPRCVMSNSFAFGGSNAAVLLRKL
jgi:3-oxoacyl-[acyl-carrier-protein] synthase I